MSIYTIEQGYSNKSIKPRRIAAILIAATIAFGGYVTYQPTESSSSNNNAPELSKPVEAIAVQPKITTAMPWPGYGQAAYGVLDKGVLATSDENAHPVPVASLAKVITALAILKEKPLKPGDQGPTITLSEKDVALYIEYINKDGAVVPVEAGEQISQYQAMQAMLMSSANNMSDSLAIWAFGSVENYTVYANNMVKELGLPKTNVADASGFSPGTVSTAHDMVQLGELYIKNPVLLGIATQPEATIPVAGKIINYNSAVNKDGILGIKIGYTDEAGRSFLVADIRKTGGTNNTIAVVAVVGADHLETAMNDAQAILRAGNNGYDQLASN